MIAAAWTGALSAGRISQVLWGIALLHFAFALLAAIRLPVLRGDVSPLRERDWHGIGPDGRAPGRDRPSRSFVPGLFGLGLLALAISLGMALLRL